MTYSPKTHQNCDIKEPPHLSPELGGAQNYQLTPYLYLYDFLGIRRCAYPPYPKQPHLGNSIGSVLFKQTEAPENRHSLTFIACPHRIPTF